MSHKYIGYRAKTRQRLAKKEAKCWRSALSFENRADSRDKVGQERGQPYRDLL